MPIIDLATKIITPEQKIWVVHPGKGRHYYDVFLKKNMAFLVMPGLNLKKDTCKSIKQVRQHIRMANALKKYHESDNPVSPPSRRASSYSDDGGKGISPAVGNVINFYNTAQPGDLIVVTGYGQYSRVLFGELIKPFDPHDTITLDEFEYGDVQYRPVKWINTEHQRREMRQELADRIVNRKASIQLNRDKVTEELYRFAYTSYVKGDKSKLELDAPKYTGKHPLATHSSTELVTYLAAAYAAMEEGKIKRFAALEIDDAIEEFYNGQLIDNFAQQFASPGKFILYSMPVLTIFTLLGVTSVTSGFPLSEFRQNTQIENSMDDTVSPELKDAGKKFDMLMNSLGDDRIKELEELGKKTQKQVGLKTTATVKKSTSKAKH